jgi:hypothetical protein
MIAFSGLLVAPHAAFPQTGDMGAPLATSAQGFTYVYDAVELPNARVLLTDSKSRPSFASISPTGR